MASLIDSIINPAQANVIGSLEKGQQRADRDLAGEILGDTLTGKIGGLARSNPEMAMNLAKSMGIPTTSTGRINNFMGVAVAAQKFVDAGIPPPQIAEFLRGEGQKVQSAVQATGEVGDGSRMMQFADRIEAGDPNAFSELQTMANAFAPKGEGLASAKTEILGDGTTIQSLPDGSTQVTNPRGEVVTGQERLEVLKSARASRINTLQAEADINVAEAQGKAIATQRASRISDITKEMSTRGRESKRGEINLVQAAKLVERAEQGLKGAALVKLAKTFPGIDVTDEAGLSQSLTLLALDELQKFKGPTTDFEFQKTEQIAGTLGDSKSANRAKIASLRRNNWFIQRESKQFNDWITAGKNPDTFGFDFGERINTKKGDFSLQDLQDTALENNLTIEETIKRLDR